MKKIFKIPDGDPEHGITVHRDDLLLYIQRFAIIFLMFGLLLVLDERKKLSEIVAGGASVCIGTAFLGLWGLELFRKWR